ncbi:MAG: hypothetical protein CLLPBCKN_007719 [Chroococcidiopsis cubana SAG 39.79]|uniref:Toprim domain-containing protein n=1 Tax=Chroococcidiopsis cubana SAG 39.79 TaxID=388085 RepID=A0AB37USV1_9CYAN|nr:toprim domain-containing protein [Chroococcidiopsis cubana]MDZ4878284.1 hypothetical protein [Chroococcidiopsis cubana SAG 39.79]RUT14467.1 hypothetical protein DSM107010_00130 [Chroococcidiopsis cubana SAG 39.79]
MPESVTPSQPDAVKKQLLPQPTTKPTVAFNRAALDHFRERQRERELLTQQILALPLEDVATRLGMAPKKGEKGKWCNEQLGNISLTAGKGWYDWNAGVGGKNATSLAMHVLGIDRRAARDWLAVQFGLSRPFYCVSSCSSAATRQRRKPIASTRKERTSRSFVVPTPDESKWMEVQFYLVSQRALPLELVEALHREGKIYASGIAPAVLKSLQQQGKNGKKLTNAVFTRQDLHGEVKGASLRDVRGKFKGLAEGSRKDIGWFFFVQGKGEVQRIALAESAIDAMSVATLTKYKHLTTLYIATDGTGTLPLELLRDCLARGGQIILAQDADRAGEKQAWNVVKALGKGNIIRAAPNLGKDWNEFLQATVTATQLERWCKTSEWWRIAQAIGKSNKYVQRVKIVAAEVESGQPLSKEAKASMERDFCQWREIGADLWKWWRAAVMLDKTADDLQQIADTALAFYAEQHPLPLTAEILLQMQQDIELLR